MFHGVENYFPWLFAMGISDAIFFKYFGNLLTCKKIIYIIKKVLLQHFCILVAQKSMQIWRRKHEFKS